MIDQSSHVSASPLLVFADDWGRHPSSCQHLVRNLLPRRLVHWVNTIGMRPPRLDAATVARVMQKLGDWRRPNQIAQSDLPKGLTLHNPKMWPWFRSRADRWLNRSLLLKQLRRVTADCAMPPIAITTIPITADLIGRLPVARWIYYCVDDFTEWPGLDRKPLQAMDRDLVLRADALIAASESLQARLSEQGRASTLLTHGVDLEHWKKAPCEAATDKFARFERPLVVFWGLIDGRMDYEFIVRTADAMRNGTLLLVGPEQAPDPRIYATRRVIRLPAVDYADLPSLAHAADVLVMPYADLPVTRAMQPLKLKEYLATGKPVVSRDLPAVRAWSDCLDMAADAEEFAALVQRRLVEGLPSSQRVARTRLADEDWRAKASLFERWVDQGSGDDDSNSNEWARAARLSCPT